MFFDLINLYKIRKALLYLFIIAAALWLQTMVFSRVEILGAKPLFLPVVAVAIGLWEGGVWGAMLGLAAGFFADLAFTGTTVMFLVLLAVFGFVTGILADFVINRRFLSYMILSAAALVLTALVQIVPLWIFRGVALPQLLPVALLQAAWGLPFAVPAYFACRAVSGKKRLG